MESRRLGARGGEGEARRAAGQPQVGRSRGPRGGTSRRTSASVHRPAARTRETGQTRVGESWRGAGRRPDLQGGVELAGGLAAERWSRVKKGHLGNSKVISEILWVPWWGPQGAEALEDRERKARGAGLQDG